MIFDTKLVHGSEYAVLSSDGYRYGIGWLYMLSKNTRLLNAVQSIDLSDINIDHSKMYNQISFTNAKYVLYYKL